MVPNLGTGEAHAVGKEKTIHTKLAGVTKRNDEGERIQSLLEDMEAYADKGDCLELEHESDNEYDDNAIKVFFEGDHIGYIKRELAAKIAPAVDEGRVKAELEEITGGNELSYGCNILVYISDEPYPILLPTPSKRQPTILDESLIETSKTYIFSKESVSIADLQTGLKIGYSKAAALMDKLEELGFVGPYAGAQPRQVLINESAGPTEDELETAKKWNHLWLKIVCAILAIFSLIGSYGAYISNLIIPALLFMGLAGLCIAMIVKSVNASKLIRDVESKNPD